MTVIGWVWIVVAVVLMSKALLNLLIWGVLKSASPELLRAAERASPRVWLFGPLLRHAMVLFACQALAWALVAFCAISLLRLRRWARVAIQAVCWANLAYVTGFLIFWAGLWTNPANLAAQDPSLTGSKRTLVILAGVGGCVLLGAALCVMLGYLRSARVRAAFAPHKSADG